VIRDENLFIKLINSEQRSETCTAESIIKEENTLADEDKMTSSRRNFSDKLLTNLNSQSSSSIQNKSMNTKSSVTSIDVVGHEAYEPLVDELLDLSDIVDLTDSPFGDSLNLTLINRALVLFDLMKNLDDKFFMDNYAFKLGKLIDNIVMQVFWKRFFFKQI